ncbi:alpha/beta fold hydrolase [Aciditerrimonas ferrireducens]|uniref:Alpha/beta fold hydrolase n=1 Tax=Aciditerrimonas ferrireducens TaxID=667306 RepID=A0ABV6C2X6_9ACTN
MDRLPTGVTRVEGLPGHGLRLAALVAGPEDGPLALCLHGFPDTAWTWRHLLPVLGAAGYRAVAPWQRGYGPSDLPEGGRVLVGAAVLDALALHEALGAGPDAVLLGHDWGALACYGALALAPERWRAGVGLAVPPGPRLQAGFVTYDQLRRSWYMFFIQHPLAEWAVAASDLAFLERLWRDWSPAYDPSEDLGWVRQALGTPERLRAALSWYRAQLDPAQQDPAFAEAQAATGRLGTRPLLYLHGSDDGCIGAELADGAVEGWPAGSRVVVLEGAGHFLHLEQPERVEEEILAFLGAP